MARSSEKEGLVLVYKYGIPYWVGLSDDAAEQLQRGLDLRRDLVASDREFDQLRADAWGAHPEVAVAQQAVDDAVKLVAEAEELAKGEWIADKSTKPRTATAALLKQTRADRAAAKAVLKSAKAAALEGMRPLLKQLDERQKLQDASLRGDAVANGLFWSTGNAILQDHKVARQQVIKARKAGTPAERRMPCWSAPATLSAQIMWHPGMPKRTPALLASGEGPWRNVLQLRPWPEDEPYPQEWQHHIGTRLMHQLTVRVAGAKKPPMVVPVILHRPLPEDADISDVQITRRFVANQMYLFVCFTTRIPAPLERTEGCTAAVKFTWSDAAGKSIDPLQTVKDIADKTKHLCVATLATPDGKFTEPVPADVKHLVRWHDTRFQILADPNWRLVLQRCDDIRSIRDENLDKMKAMVQVVVLKDKKLAAAMAQALGRERLDLHLWRAPGRMVRLYQAWPEDHPLKTVLNQWRQRDLHLWQYEAHQRQQIIARRRDAYRKLAAWICGPDTQWLALSDVDIAKIREAAPVGTEDTYQERGARANIQWAAPGDFRAVLQEAAVRRGIKIISMPADPMAAPREK